MWKTLIATKRKMSVLNRIKNCTDSHFLSCRSASLDGCYDHKGGCNDTICQTWSAYKDGESCVSNSRWEIVERDLRLDWLVLESRQKRPDSFNLFNLSVSNHMSADCSQDADPVLTNALKAMQFLTVRYSRCFLKWRACVIP